MPSSHDSIGTRGGSVKAGKDPQLSLEGLDSPEVDEPHGREYRAVPVRTVDLPSDYIEDAGGVLTRKGTPRVELLAAARAAFLQRKEDATDSDALSYDSGQYAVRKEGTFIKSIQGFAEDISRRVYKRAVPEGDPQDDEWFSRLYERTRAALRRSDHLRNEGPAVEKGGKKVRDYHGRRWRLTEGLVDAESGRKSADPRPFVRCTGDAPKTEAPGAWTRVERHVAREESLHQEFTHAITASDLRGPRRTAAGRRWERRHVKNGSDRPRYCTIGRWRESEVDRIDRGRCAVRVPWIVAEIDGRGEHGEKDRVISDRLARRLLRRLEALGVDLSDVVISYSGNASIHVRIPDGAVGCPVYRSARDARSSIRGFFDELCDGIDSASLEEGSSGLPADPELREAIDDACFRPGQLIRAIGSTHEDTGRQTVGTTGETFMAKPQEFLWHLSEAQFEYSPPERFPLPRRAEFNPLLSTLLEPPKSEAAKRGEKTNVRQRTSPPGGGRSPVVARVRGGVSRGEDWGRDVDRPACGRNCAALFMSHHLLRRCVTPLKAWGDLLLWNQRNSPPLSRGELRGVYDSAHDFQRGYV